MARGGRFDISLKRVYDPPSDSDGLRILVERLWPRGLSKEKACLHHWLRDVAPSPELRRWYGHRPERWPAFRSRYHAELDANPDAVGALESLCAPGPVTFVFAARDRELNGAVALKSYLDILSTGRQAGGLTTGAGRHRPRAGPRSTGNRG